MSTYTPHYYSNLHAFQGSINPYTSSSLATQVNNNLVSSAQYSGIPDALTSASGSVVTTAPEITSASASASVTATLSSAVLETAASAATASGSSAGSASSTASESGIPSAPASSASDSSKSSGSGSGSNGSLDSSSASSSATSAAGPSIHKGSMKVYGFLIASVVCTTVFNL